MKIQLPSFASKDSWNDICNIHAISEWRESLPKQKQCQLEYLTQYFCSNFPPSKNLSEDTVMELLIRFLSRQAGWSARDKRNSFLPGTELKPDIWLNNGASYFEAVRHKTRYWQGEWVEHCRRTVEYSKHADSRVAFCSDGRRWFIASTINGALKTVYLDAKKYDERSPEVLCCLAFIWRHGPLFKKEARKKLYEYTELSKTLFKNHVLRLGNALDDNYKELFGLISACAYAHYNNALAKVLNTRLLFECIYALAHEHDTVAHEIIKKYTQELSQKSIPGISNLAIRSLNLLGKNQALDIQILRSLLVDESDKPISWNTFNSDDLSEIYEELAKNRRKKLGIYATPRDLCWNIIDIQLSRLNLNNMKHLAMIDPCCGSGSFLDQAAKALGRSIYPVGAQLGKVTTPKRITFIGQDIDEIAVAIAMVNACVAITRYLWHLERINIDIMLSTGNSTDKRSPLFRRMDRLKPSYSLVFGNPPYLRSRSKRFGGVTKTGNFLFQITEKAMSLCKPGMLGFVLPAHLKGGNAAEQFYDVSTKSGLRTIVLFHLPEVRFRGCSEKRHMVVIWDADKRPDAKTLVLTPPKHSKQLGLRKALEMSRTRESLHFTTDIERLSEIPLFPTYYIPDELKDALNELDTLGEWQSKQYFTVVQSIQIAHPRVPRPSRRNEDESRYNAIIEREGYIPNAPLFVLNSDEAGNLCKKVKGDLTPLEIGYLRPFLEHAPNMGGFIPEKSEKVILFMNKEMGRLSESEFSKKAPHFYAWLKKYKPLLMLDKDRKSGQLQWWELQRCREPKPSARKKPGIDFSLPKILVARMLHGQLWAWSDLQGHIAGGTTFCAISPFPGSPHATKLREKWYLSLTAWLNSYLIRQIWIKQFGNFKLRGIDGEVQMKHLHKLPVPSALIIESSDREIRRIVSHMDEIANKLSKKIDQKSLGLIDKMVWKLLMKSTNRSLGTPLTRVRDEPIELRAMA